VRVVKRGNVPAMRYVSCICSELSGSGCWNCSKYMAPMVDCRRRGNRKEFEVIGNGKMRRLIGNKTSGTLQGSKV
jgi:hypothetical protein